MAVAGLMVSVPVVLLLSQGQENAGSHTGAAQSAPLGSQEMGATDSEEPQRSDVPSGAQAGVFPHTKLALRLAGTVALRDEAQSWAAIEELDERRHSVVRIGDVLLDVAEVVSIEAQRILLDHQGRREELRVAGRAAGREPQRTAADRSSGNEDVQQIAQNHYAVRRKALQAFAEPSAIMKSTDVRVLPRQEGGRLVGVQVNHIRPGTFWAEAGVENGDVLTAFNGVALSEYTDAAAVLSDLDSLAEVQLVVAGLDGRQREIRYSLR